MRAQAILKHNIDALLRARHQTRQDLAQWCRRTPAWLTQVLNKPQRELPIKYLDRVADFFGLATYQLFQPGLSKLTERRSGLERRGGRDRRISKALQLEATMGPPMPTPDEWVLLSKRRKLTAEEQLRLDHAADVLLLSQDDGAKTGRPERSKAGTTRAARGPLRARKERPDDPVPAAEGTKARP